VTVASAAPIPANLVLTLQRRFVHKSGAMITWRGRHDYVSKLYPAVETFELASQWEYVEPSRAILTVTYTPPPSDYAPITFLPTDRSEHGQPQVDDGEAPEPTAQEEV
jgi:hypothetical protein